MEDALKSIKEFIWDILGYLIPGITLVILFNFIISPEIITNDNFIFDWEEFKNYLILVIAYVLGYLIYSLSIFKLKIQNFVIEKINIPESNKLFKYINILIKSKHGDFWRENIENEAFYISAKDFLKANNYSEIDNMKYNNIRNILMSRNPEMDQKVYTFMFRSALFDHISTIFYLIVLMVILQLNIDYKFLKTDLIHKVFYVSTLVLIPLLGNCKRIFYSIAQRLPISNLK
ncbi:hypothetical protein [Faecalibacter sp. LW9]|uniref:hypothetical protein n=1 Tax=Faecalibacter sp. LW9 TaxID=3103144 RepID=UPI002AFF8EA2|nr:hypothetical protein [Faecalibacter sp. LW9]